MVNNFSSSEHMCRGREEGQSQGRKNESGFCKRLNR